MSILYKFWQFFWSVYFVFTIAVIGFVMGYVVSLFFFFLSYLFLPLPLFSRFFSSLADYIQCYSIRFLLKIQPWLNCKNNFQSIHGFYDQYKTRKIMFVSNHRSNLDTFFLISLIPGLRGLAKSSIYYNIFFAPYMMAAGFVPVKKGSISGFVEGLRVLKTKILEKNKAALVFPETTRCEKGFGSIGKFSTAVFEVAISSSSLVVPIYIHKTDEVMGRGDLLIHPFKPIELKILKAVSAESYKNSAELTEYVWNTLKAEQLQMSAACN